MKTFNFTFKYIIFIPIAFLFWVVNYPQWNSFNFSQIVDFFLYHIRCRTLFPDLNSAPGLHLVFSENTKSRAALEALNTYISPFVGPEDLMLTRKISDIEEQIRHIEQCVGKNNPKYHYKIWRLKKLIFTIKHLTFSRFPELDSFDFDILNLMKYSSPGSKSYADGYTLIRPLQHPPLTYKEYAYMQAVHPDLFKSMYLKDYRSYRLPQIAFFDMISVDYFFKDNIPVLSTKWYEMIINLKAVWEHTIWNEIKKPFNNYFSNIFKIQGEIFSSTYSSLFLFTCIAICLSTIIGNISRFFANDPKPFDREKISTYECGFHPFSELEHSQLFIFYRLAVFFIIFESELMFLFPWLINLLSFCTINVFFFYSPFIFIAVIIIGFFYEIKENALNILKLMKHNNYENLINTNKLTNWQCTELQTIIKRSRFFQQIITKYYTEESFNQAKMNCSLAKNKYIVINSPKGALNPEPYNLDIHPIAYIFNNARFARLVSVIKQVEEDPFVLHLIRTQELDNTIIFDSMLDNSSKLQIFIGSFDYYKYFIEQYFINNFDYNSAFISGIITLFIFTSTIVSFYYLINANTIIKALLNFFDTLIGLILCFFIIQSDYIGSVILMIYLGAIIIFFIFILFTMDPKKFAGNTNIYNFTSNTIQNYFFLYYNTMFISIILIVIAPDFTFFSIDELTQINSIVEDIFLQPLYTYSSEQTFIEFLGSILFTRYSVLCSILGILLFVALYCSMRLLNPKKPIVQVKFYKNQKKNDKNLIYGKL